MGRAEPEPGCMSTPGVERDRGWRHQPAASVHRCIGHRRRGRMVGVGVGAVGLGMNWNEAIQHRQVGAVSWLGVVVRQRRRLSRLFNGIAAKGTLESTISGATKPVRDRGGILQ